MSEQAQLALGDVLKQEALARVEERNKLFVNAAFTAIVGRAGQPTPFTSDDIWPLVFNDGTVEPRAMGAAFKSAASRKFIRPTGRYVQSRQASNHGREVKEWIGYHHQIPQ